MALTLEERQLLRLIESSFPSATPTPSEIVECDCPECRDLAAAFGGKKWIDVPDSTIETACDSLPLFSDEALCFYLPAYLHRSVRDLTDITSVSEFLFYSLTPGSSTLQRFSKLSESQVFTVYKYLDYYMGHEVNDIEVRETVEYWKSLAAQQ